LTKETPTVDDYAKNYSRAVRYSADAAGAHHLLSPESLTDADRWGGPGADHTKRGVIADYLQDLGRDEEADHLRSGRHVVVRDGKVEPGRWTLRPLHDYADDVATMIYQAGADGDWEAQHPPFHVGTPHEIHNHPVDFLPGASFQDVKPDPYGGHDYLDEADAHRSPHRVHRDAKTGLPLVRGSTFTCHDFEAPIHEAAQQWSQLLTDTVFHPGNNVVGHLDGPTQQRLERQITDGARRLSLEEVDPDHKRKE
jgi:hypothetical protein